MLILAGASAAAAQETRIAAIVNDDMISLGDLEARIRLVLLSSQLPDNDQVRQRVTPQVLRTLIDEKLEVQEAKRFNVTVSDDEVSKAVERLEQQNNMPKGGLDQLLSSHDIPRSTLTDQIRSGIIWNKLVDGKLASSVSVSDEEIKDTLARIKQEIGKSQYRVAEIFLAVDNPAQDGEVRALAERLTQQMRQGARFSAVAQQFSQSATAAVGGDIGWLRPDQLPPELGKAVSALRPGELSAPIRVTGGYYLLLVVDRRNGTSGSEQDTVFDIVQVVFPLPARPSDAIRRAALGEAASIRTAAKDCPSLLKIGKEKAPQLSSEGQLRASTISPEMRAVVNRLAIGQASEPIVQKNGVGVIMVCAKSTSGGGGLTREDVTESLLRQRLDTVARRYLRDLRRNAYVDVRV